MLSATLHLHTSLNSPNSPARHSLPSRPEALLSSCITFWHQPAFRVYLFLCNCTWPIPWSLYLVRTSTSMSLASCHMISPSTPWVSLTQLKASADGQTQGRAQFDLCWRTLSTRRSWRLTFDEQFTLSKNRRPQRRLDLLDDGLEWPPLFPRCNRPLLWTCDLWTCADSAENQRVRLITRPVSSL